MIRGAKRALPVVYDTRRVYLVKVAHAAEAGPRAVTILFGTPRTQRRGAPRLDRQRRSAGENFAQRGKWIAANSSAADQTDASGKQYRGRKVTGAQVWLLREDDAAQIGVWQ